jgi:hypothetical protein
MRMAVWYPYSLDILTDSSRNMKKWLDFKNMSLYQAEIESLSPAILFENKYLMIY